jgi:hypothetical protein
MAAGTTHGEVVSSTAVSQFTARTTAVSSTVWPSVDNALPSASTPTSIAATGCTVPMAAIVDTSVHAAPITTSPRSTR